MTAAAQASLEAATRAEPKPPEPADWVPPPAAPPKPRAVANKWLPVEETPPEPETSALEDRPAPPPQPPATELRHQESPTQAFVVSEESNGATVAEVGEPSREPSIAEVREPEPVERGPVPSEARATSVSTSRQRAAVEAYCRELCPPDAASAATAEALASAADTDDVELLRRTRSVAARYAAKPSRHGWRRVLPGERDGGCASTPALLAARANDELPPPGHGALERHLHSCLICQAADLRTRRAERAFAGITGTELTPQEVPAAREAALTTAAEKWAPPTVVEERARARTAHEGTTAAAAPPRAPVVDRAEAHRPHRRLPAAVVAAGAGAVAAAAIAAALLLSTGSSKHNTVARATTPVAPVTTAVAAPSKAQPAAKKPAKKPAPHPAAAPAATPASAASSAAPASSSPSSASQSAASSSSSASSPSASSSPPASSSAPSSPPASNPAPSSPPSVSIQQPSLGSANAPQGVGK